MSVKPLDLQVNINTIHITSQREGARVAEHVFSQRQMDEKLIEEAKRNLHRIGKSEESYASQMLSDRSEDDKLVNQREDSDDRQNEKQKQEKSETKKEDSSAQSSSAEEKNPLHRIDTLA